MAYWEVKKHYLRLYKQAQRNEMPIWALNNLDLWYWKSLDIWEKSKNKELPMATRNMLYARAHSKILRCVDALMSYLCQETFQSRRDRLAEYWEKQGGGRIG